MEFNEWRKGAEAVGNNLRLRREELKAELAEVEAQLKAIDAVVGNPKPSGTGKGRPKGSKNKTEKAWTEEKA